MAICISINHIGGISIIIGGKNNKLHAIFGWFFSILIRIPVSVGWYIMG